MAVVSNGQVLSPAALRALVLMGGDTSALIADGSEDDPATRGAHLIVRYQAALNRFYEDWHGRALHALNAYAATRRGSLTTLSVLVQSTMAAAATRYIPLAWNRVNDSLGVYNRAAGMPAGLPGSAARMAHYNASSQVVVAGVAATHAAERHIVDHHDVHGLQYTVHDIFAAQGMTSAELLGNAVDFSGQVLQVRGAAREYMEQVAQYASEEAQAAAADKAAKRSALGSLIGMVTNIAGSFVR